MKLSLRHPRWLVFLDELGMRPQEQQGTHGHRRPEDMTQAAVDAIRRHGADNADQRPKSRKSMKSVSRSAARARKSWKQPTEAPGEEEAPVVAPARGGRGDPVKRGRQRRRIASAEIRNQDEDESDESNEDLR